MWHAVNHIPISSLRGKYLSISQAPSWYAIPTLSQVMDFLRLALSFSGLVRELSRLRIIPDRELSAC